MRPKTILAAVDLSPISERVVAAAVGLAQAFGGRILLHHVVPVPPAGAGFDPTVDLQALLEGAEHTAREQISALGRGVDAIPLETICEVGVPTADICRVARERRVDYIVLGSHGHSSLYELIIGSTAQGVLKHAPCPVMIVPARS